MVNGIEFFYFPTWLSMELKFINYKFGAAGIGVIVMLLQRIYGIEGYYLEWSEDLALIFSAECKSSTEFVNEVISEAVHRGVFHKELYEKYGILTSAEIQKHFLTVTKRRKNRRLTEEFLLEKN